MYRLARNRLLLIESIFRDNSLYAFWFLNRIITKELFFKEFLRRKYDKKDKVDPAEQDPFKKLFGVAMPNDIPESSAWCEPQRGTTYRTISKTVLMWHALVRLLTLCWRSGGESSRENCSR